MESLSELVCLVLYSKLSSCRWAHMSGCGGPNDRSASLLVGRARLSRTAETLVGGDPWVPMSHTWSTVERMEAERMIVSSDEVGRATLPYILKVR
jgi:hypothetical protein